MTPDGYEPTAQIVRGRTKVRAEVEELRAWIAAEYDVEVLNITTDSFSVGGVERSRVTVWVRQGTDREFLHDGTNYIAARQRAIAEKATAVALPVTKSRRWRTVRATPDTLIVAAAFDSEAHRAAMRTFSLSDWTTFRDSLANPDLWRVEAFGSRVVFFVYTDEQKARYQGSAEYERWIAAFVETLAMVDEFGVCTRDSLHPEVDSKQNFDENYQSNGGYYW